MSEAMLMFSIIAGILILSRLFFTQKKQGTESEELYPPYSNIKQPF
jgi:hypothetical protein